MHFRKQGEPCVFLHETHFTKDAAFWKMQWGETVLFSNMAPPVDQQVLSNASTIALGRLVIATVDNFEGIFLIVVSL